MQTKTTNKLWALALSLIMLLTLIPVSAFTFSTTASAAENKHVFESSKLTAAAAGAYKDGEAVKVDDYFTIYMSAKTKIDKSEKTWADDGYASAQRLNLGGKGDVAAMKNLISFKTGNAATVKIWFAQGGDDNRQIAIWDASGAQVTATDIAGMTKNTAYYTELKLDKAGTYFMGGASNNNYFFKVEVEEAAAAATENVFESSKLTAAAAGAYTDGQEVKVDDFFTLYMSAKTKIDKSEKTWADDGYTSAQRLNLGGKGDVAAMKNLISFKTGAAATVKIWFAQGGDDNRQIAIWDASGAQVAITDIAGMTKNTAYYTELKLDKAGTYFMGGATNNNYFFKVAVVSGGGTVVRGDWSKVAAPTIESVALNAEDKSKIDITVNAVVGNDGADKLSVVVLDKDGKEIDVKNTVVENNKHVITYAPESSGKYTFTAKLIRDGEADKVGTDKKSIDFVKPLGIPVLSSATSKGDGKVSIKWDKVDEATGYKVYVDGKEVGTSATEMYMATGLTVDKKYSFTVAATRAGETGAQSKAISATATKDAQQEWGFTAYGTSTGSSKNKYEGNLNDGKVTVIAQGGAGKLNLAADDGYSFYYTAVPANKNFTFRAKIHVDEWTYSNGQEGFGVAAVDMLPEKSFDTSHWTNFYMASVGRFSPFKAQQGVGVMAKVGITPENWQAVKDNAFDRTQLYAARAGEPLDEYGATATAQYNIVGNVKNPDALTAKNIKTVAELVDFDLEITKNNTGFYCSYYKDGKLVKTVKHWGTEDLSQLDKDNIYVGIVAARNFTVSLKNTDYTLEIRDPSQDPAREPKPATYVTPSISIESGAYGNSTSYDLLLKPSHKGTVTVKVNGEVVAENKVIGDKLDSDGNIVETILPVTIKSGKNPITVDYKADTTVDLGESVKFSKTDLSTSVTVDYNTYFAKQENIYVAPNAKSGNGGKDSPYALATALTLARPGQKIILKEGTYKYKDRLQVPREVDGTKDAMIYLMADPEAKTRPVLDFEGSTGIGLQILGDYWYLKGFDVTHAGNNGLRIDGNYCVADQIHAYYNYGTGISIQMDSKFSREIWPTYNTIKNCDAYYNADSGEEDADGFSAKFCIGVGNVFDNCVAYGNADDGWDLYGRNYPMEAVIVKNCVAYKNGYREDGSRGKGNGNGFKLGGDNNSARHQLINSVSFMNGADGITNNSNPNIIVKDCISYKNDKAGINLYTKASNTDFTSEGVISYKNGAADTFGYKGSQDVKKVDQTYWNGANGVADNWFKSVEFSGKVARKADGSIDMQGFLELTDKAPKNAGAKMEGAKSGNVTINPDEVLPNPITGNAALPVTVGVLALAGAAVFVLTKKRKH